MTPTPRISVIIPVYNHATELIACLKMLQAQTLKPSEVIVVDDGSADQPKEAVQLSGVFGEVKEWITLSKNRGAPVARNTGMDASSGEYVIFLDADATLSPDALKKLADALMADPEAAFAYSAFRFGGKVFLSQPFSSEALAAGNDIHTSALIRRSACPRFDETLKKFQDWDLWLQIAQAGGRGVYVPELLLTIGERKQFGMSRWIPSFAYRLPWSWIGFEPRAVTSYRDAKAVIDRKHAAWMKVQAERTEKPTFSSRQWIASTVAVALLSAFSLGTVWSAVFALVLTGLMVIASFRRPSFALALLGLELMLGSKGGWLKVGADAVNDGGIGIRILLFAAFFLGYGISLLKTGEWRELKALVRERWLAPYAVLALAVIWACVRGVALKQPFMAADANAWGFFLALIPAAMLWRTQPEKLAREFRSMLPVGIALLTAFTIGLFLTFSQAPHIPAWTQTLYTWVRRSGLGEITHAKANVYRIFLASQIMLLPAWLHRYDRATKDLRPFTLRVWGGWIAVGIALIISLSRSFWVGFAVGAAAIGLQALMQVPSDGRKKQLWRVFGRPLLAIVGAIACLSLVYSAPAVSARLNAGEAAASSRRDLLPVMLAGIKRHAVLGSGFGATLTYQTKDPRIVQKTGGTYTTYAFEWGWLDIWYKFGILGVAAIVWVLASLIIRSARAAVPAWGFVAGTVIALAAVHVFTPYLNHPLGIGILIFLEGYVQYQSRKNVS